jgi:hypothetical protein
VCLPSSVARSAVNSEYKCRDDLISPTKSAIVESTMAVVNRVANLLAQANSIPVEMIAGFALNFDFSCLATLSFIDGCDVFIVILMMAGFLRGSEATELDPEDVWLERIEDNEMVCIYVAKSKTDQDRKGLTLLKRHDNWKSDAIFIYIKSSLGECLPVTQSFI